METDPGTYAFKTQAQKDKINTLPVGQQTPQQMANAYRDAGVASPYLGSTGLISTERGVDILNERKRVEAKLTPTPTKPTETKTETTPVKPTGSVTLINPTTGQSLEFGNPDANKANIMSYLKSGYSLSEASGSIPTWLTPTSGTSGGTVATSELDTAKADLEKAKSNLLNLNVENDPALKALLDPISAQWDARIADMERINNSRESGFEATGNRLGSRYTGGLGKSGMFGGIISEEERQGAQRIAELNTQKNAALAAARAAYEDKQWTKYAKAVDLAQQKYKDIYQEVSDLNKAQAAQDKLLADEAKEIREQERKKYEESVEKDRLFGVEASVSDALASGMNDLNDIFRTVASSGIKTNTKEVADAIKNLSDIEKTAPGIVGEWIAARENDPDFANVGLKEYLQIKNPESALDLQQKQLQLQKLQKEIDQMDNPPSEAPDTLLAYAQQYAATGAIPSGLPKGSFGVVAKIAKELPKTKGAIISVSTGVTPTGDSALVGAAGALYSAIDLAKQLRQLDDERIGGVVSGLTGKVFGSEDQQKYVDLRGQIVDLLSRARSGAALTAGEEKRYTDMLPGRFSEPLGLGADSTDRIDNFINNLSTDLKNKTGSQGWAIYGFTPVKIDGKEFIVGDIVDNAQGKTGRVNADGTITLLESEEQAFNSVGNTTASIKIPKESRLSYVNNNPGNLKFVGQAGATQGDGGFAKFQTPEAGLKALERQIQLDASRGLTLSEFIHKFAPPSENDTAKYIKDVMSWTGADTKTAIADINLKKLLAAIARKESSTTIG